MPLTFNKSERLCSKKTLGELFKKGSASVQTFYLFPFRVLYMDSAAPMPATIPQPAAICEAVALDAALPAIVITVPKRMFKRAVDRNLIRRRVREAYRLNKSLLTRQQATMGPSSRGVSSPANIAFLYTAKQIISFEEIEKGMKSALRKMGN